MPIVALSARKHGVDDGDIIHAYRNPVRIWELGEGLIMVMADRAGNLLEIGYVQGARSPVVVHAMAAREKFLR